MNALLRSFQKENDVAPETEASADPGGLSALLASLYALGRAAHPQLALCEIAFGRSLARAVAGGSPQHLRTLAITDLYLACACAEKMAGAAAVFETRYAQTIARAVARVLSAPVEREEAEQRTRDHLLVGDHHAPPKIAQYVGRGPLGHWVSVAAIRVAVSHGRAESSSRRLQQKATAEAIGRDPELVYMKDEVRRRLEIAVEEALARLEDRARLVLRLYLVSGMSLAAIGQTFGVSQPTVSRWLVTAREDVLSGVRTVLADRFRIPPDDLRSMVRLAASQFEVSISRVLGSA